METSGNTSAFNGGAFNASAGNASAFNASAFNASAFNDPPTHNTLTGLNAMRTARDISMSTSVGTDGEEAAGT